MPIKDVFALALATLVAASACMEADKGAEDDVPIDGKDDSFQRPSDHGVLSFGLPNSAAFSDAEGFHMWTFTLTAGAQVDLSTALDTQNLDTVMYLYKRTSSSASWGASIDKNDDASDDTAASRLKKTLDKGQYRVLVKAYKRTQRGDFSMLGQCTGAGCPATSTCTAPEALPDATGYGGTCGAKLAAIYEYGSIDTQQNTDVDLAERCTLPALERKAIDYYASYFSLDPDASLSIEARALGGTGSGGGTVVDVGDGGDESTISFVFDAADRLVASYWHNQSPEALFYCRESSAAAIDLPNVESCVGALVSELPHGADDEGDVSLTSSTGALSSDVGAEVSGPMRRYASSNGTSSSTTLTAEGASWELFDGKATRLTVSASNKPATRYVATDDMIVLEAPANKPAALVCQ